MKAKRLTFLYLKHSDNYSCFPCFIFRGCLTEAMAMLATQMLWWLSSDAAQQQHVPAFQRSTKGPDLLHAITEILFHL